jgi:hypothetical protein
LEHERRDEKIALGRCPRCGSPEAEGGRRCSRCEEALRDAARERNRLDKAAGICVQCRKRPICPESKSRCRIDLDRNAARQREKAAAAREERENSRFMLGALGVPAGPPPVTRAGLRAENARLRMLLAEHGIRVEAADLLPR